VTAREHTTLDYAAIPVVVVKVVLYPGLPGRRVWPADDSPLLDRAKSLGGPWCFDPSKIDIQWKV
jgi:hypothetical protein